MPATAAEEETLAALDDDTDEGAVVVAPSVAKPSAAAVEAEPGHDDEGAVAQGHGRPLDALTLRIDDLADESEPFDDDDSGELVDVLD